MKNVVEYLLEKGINFNHSGFDYLRKAIEFCLEDESLSRNLDKKLYIKLTEYFKTTKYVVVRAIFYAICSLNERTTAKKFIRKAIIDLREK